MDERELLKPDSGAQLSPDNPVTRHPRISPPKQDLPEPGLDAKLDPQADHGEKSYVGTGRLKGGNALITGGDSGIGAAVAIAFAREVADVAIAYLPAEAEDARKVIGVFEAEGRVGIGLAGDLLDADCRNSLADEAAEKLGGLDILVNNAGKQIAIENLEDLDVEQVLQTFQVNILAMFTATRAALKHRPAGSSIINTTSVQAYNPSPTLLDYASTKAAINAFTKGMGVQLAPAEFASSPLRPVPSGPRGRSRTASPRMHCRSSGTMFPSAVPASPWNWRPPTYSSRRPNPATSSGRP